MIRKVIRIDEEKCTGCGLCAQACREGAIAMVDGKAKLVRDDYCDGLGNCLPVCPAGAISFEEREAAAFDADAAAANLPAKRAFAPAHPTGCPGSAARSISRKTEPSAEVPANSGAESRLTNWPVQIKLVPVGAKYLENADLLISADCTAYARGDFHERFVKGRAALIGCPKLDGVDYADKLTEIFRNHSVRSVTVARMEVPCCGGIENAVRQALARSGKTVPLHVVTLSVEGRIL